MKLDKMMDPDEPIGCDFSIRMKKCASNHPERHYEHPISGGHIRFESLIDIDGNDGFIEKKLKDNGIEIEYEGFLVMVTPELLEDLNHYHGGVVPNIKKIKVDGFHFPLKETFQGKLEILKTIEYRPEVREYCTRSRRLAINGALSSEWDNIDCVICSLELLD